MAAAIEVVGRVANNVRHAAGLPNSREGRIMGFGVQLGQDGRIGEGVIPDASDRIRQFGDQIEVRENMKTSLSRLRNVTKPVLKGYLAMALVAIAIEAINNMVS